MSEHPGTAYPDPGVQRGAVDPYGQPQAAPWSQPVSSSQPAPAWFQLQPVQEQWTPYATPSQPAPGSYPERRPTNPWAVTALVTGILAIFPVAIAAGIAALVQIRRRHQGGTGLAIGGIVAGAAWMFIGMVVASVAYLSSESDYAYLGRVANAGSTDVGACLLAPSGDDSVAAEIGCARGHYAEVYLVEELGDQAPWPGGDRTDELADDACYDAFEGYVGASYDASEFDYNYFVPDQAEWSSGEHRAVCVVVPVFDETRRGSVRGSQR